MKSNPNYLSWLLLSLLLAVCALGPSPELDGGTPAKAPSLALLAVHPVTTDSEGRLSARPEVVATSDRVFVVYLAHSVRAERTFDVKVFDPDLSRVISSQSIVRSMADYGSPTDIRVVSDGQYAYAFYETHKPESPTSARTFLWGAKFALTDSFDRVAGAAEPIADSKPMSELAEGGELLDDPAPLLGPDSVFVVTRLKYSLAPSGRAVYWVREFSKESLAFLRSFKVDLSAAVKGRGRVTSLLAWGSNILMAVATTASSEVVSERNDDGALSDILLLRLAADFSFDPQRDVFTVSAEPGDRENYVSGLKALGPYLYVTYKESVGAPPNGAHRAWIKVLDEQFRPVAAECVRTTPWGPGGGELRPSLEVAAGRVFSGQSAGASFGQGHAEVFVYEVR